MNGTATIQPDDRALAAITHLSGLAGYIVPLGGIIVPIVIWIVKSESATISGIAKQAVLLNLAVFLLVVATALLWLTIILIPLVVLFWCVLGIIAVALPVVGAIKASQGDYFRYPGWASGREHHVQVPLLKFTVTVTTTSIGSQLSRVGVKRHC